MQVGPLLQGVSTRAGQQKLMCLRLALAGLEGLESATLPAAPSPQEPAAPLHASPTTHAAHSEGASLGAAADSGDGRAAAVWAQSVQKYPFLGSDADR